MKNIGCDLSLLSVHVTESQNRTLRGREHDGVCSRRKWMSEVCGGEGVAVGEVGSADRTRGVIL